MDTSQSTPAPTVDWLLYAQLALGMIIFGSGTPISKIVTDAFPTFLASGMRMLFAAAILLPLIAAQQEEFLPPREDWPILGAIALIGMFGFSVFMLFGMRQIPGVVGAIVMSTTPAITALGAFLFLNNQLGGRRIAGIALAVLGVLVMNVIGSTGGGFDVTGSLVLGSLLVFAAVCSEAAYTLLGRKASAALTPLQIAGYASGLALVVFLPFAGWEALTFDFSTVSLEAWLGVIWWGLGTLALGSWLWYSGVSKASGATAAGFMGLMPVSALVLSYVLLGEPFRVVHLLGFGIVFAGTLLVIWANIEESSEG